MNVDMSAKAITDRLRLAAQLAALCLALGKARPIGEAALRDQQPRIKVSDAAS